MPMLQPTGHRKTVTVRGVVVVLWRYVGEGRLEAWLRNPPPPPPRRIPFEKFNVIAVRRRRAHEARVLPRIRELLDAGFLLTQIADTLNAEGVPPPARRPWRYDKVRDICRRNGIVTLDGRFRDREPDAGTLKRIRELAGAGVSDAKISATLRMRGRAPSGARWSGQVVGYIRRKYGIPAGGRQPFP